MKFSDLFKEKPKVSAAREQLEATLRAARETPDPGRREALHREIELLNAEVAFDELILRDAQGPSLAGARDQLRKLGELVSVAQAATATPNSALNVLLVIDLAIHHGAPIYNAGSHIGCAYQYDCAARIILRMLEKHGGKESFLPAVTKRFGVISFGPITAMSAGKRAWELRHAFDDTIAMLAAPEPASTPNETASAGPENPKRVFVSYAEEDIDAAHDIVRLLESESVPCWIASRDILTGSTYARAIMDAIENTEIVLLVLSHHSNASKFVPNEIERAFSLNKRILTVRIEDVEPSRDLGLFVGPRHWINLIPGLSDLAENRRTLLRNIRPRSVAGNSKAGTGGV